MYLMNKSVQGVSVEVRSIFHPAMSLLFSCFVVLFAKPIIASLDYQFDWHGKIGQTFCQKARIPYRGPSESLYCLYKYLSGYELAYLAQMNFGELELNEPSSYIENIRDMIIKERVCPFVRVSRYVVSKVGSRKASEVCQAILNSVESLTFGTRPRLFLIANLFCDVCKIEYSNIGHVFYFMDLHFSGIPKDTVQRIISNDSANSSSFQDQDTDTTIEKIKHILKHRHDPHIVDSRPLLTIYNDIMQLGEGNNPGSSDPQYSGQLDVVERPPTNTSQGCSPESNITTGPSTRSDGQRALASVYVHSFNRQIMPASTGIISPRASNLDPNSSMGQPAFPHVPLPYWPPTLYHAPHLSVLPSVSAVRQTFSSPSNTSIFIASLQPNAAPPTVSKPNLSSLINYNSPFVTFENLISKIAFYTAPDLFTFPESEKPRNSNYNGLESKRLKILVSKLVAFPEHMTHGLGKIVQWHACKYMDWALGTNIAAHLDQTCNTNAIGRQMQAILVNYRRSVGQKYKRISVALSNYVAYWLIQACPKNFHDYCCRTDPNNWKFEYIGPDMLKTNAKRDSITDPNATHMRALTKALGHDNKGFPLAYTLACALPNPVAPITDDFTQYQGQDLFNPVMAVINQLGHPLRPFPENIEEGLLMAADLIVKKATYI